jgi:hypothetical protein
MRRANMEADKIIFVFIVLNNISLVTSQANPEFACSHILNSIFS